MSEKTDFCDLKIVDDAYGKVDSSLKHWSNNRKCLHDLYPSERFFLEPALRKATSCLDVGCAAGGSFEFTREVNQDIHYYGIDISGELIALAKKRYSESNFAVFDGINIPPQKKQPDLVFSLGVIHHLPHWREMISQMSSCAINSIVFDLRLTNEPNLDCDQVFQQKIQFDESVRSSYAIPYLVLLLDNFKDFMSKLSIENNFSISCYGYTTKPTKLSNCTLEKVIACSVLIEKNAEIPKACFDGLKLL